MTTPHVTNFDIVQAGSFIDANGDPVGGGGGGTTFDYAGSVDGADIWTDIDTALGFNGNNQNAALRVSVSVIDEAGEAWLVYREDAEGWGVGYTRIFGTNSVPQAGTYTVLGLWVTNV